MKTMNFKAFLPCLFISLSVAVLFTSCGSDDDDGNNRPPNSDAGKDHTYQFAVNGGATYQGTVPNQDMVSMHTSFPPMALLSTTFFNDIVSFNCQYGFENNVVKPLGDLGGSVGEGSTILISINDGEIAYFSVSGSVTISNLAFQNVTGNMSWATYTVHFDGLFADSIDETANVVEVSGTYTVYPEAD